jgi:hypothetical protein
MVESQVDEQVAPDDFRIHYEWQAGSMPPPHHYGYLIEIGPGGEGMIAFRPDYPHEGVPVWREPFQVAPEQWARLYQIAQEKGLWTRPWPRHNDGSVGGSLAWLRAAGDGREVEIPPRLNQEDSAVLAQLYQAIRALVPESVWAKLLARRQEYMKQTNDE